MKHLMKLLFVPFLLFFSCTTQVDGVLNDGDLPQNNEDASVEATLHPVGISFSKSSIAAFAEEFAVTSKIQEVMGIMDVRVLDHIIISKNGYFSFLEEGVL